MREHVANVQALRGVACLLVVLYHLHTWDVRFGSATPGLGVFQWFGFAGVDIFFVLSGFVITTTNRRHLGRPAAVPGYLFRRAWRIYPAYWAAMGLTAVAGCLVFDWSPFSGEAVAGWPGWLTLVPVGPPNALIGQAWTLTYELMFYLAFGALLFLPRRFAAAALGEWAVVAAAALARPVPASPLAELPQSPFVFEFLGGCLVAWLAARGVRRGWRVALALGVAYAAVGAAVVAATVPLPYGAAMTSSRLRVLVFGPAAVLVVYGCVAAEGRWPRQVPGWLLRTGDASYSLYLLHFTVMLLAVVVGLRLPHSRGPHVLWLAGTLAATLGVGFLFYRFVERPLLNLAKRRKPVPAVPSPEPLPEPAPPARRAA